MSISKLGSRGWSLLSIRRKPLEGSLLERGVDMFARRAVVGSGVGGAVVDMDEESSGIASPDKFAFVEVLCDRSILCWNPRVGFAEVNRVSCVVEVVDIESDCSGDNDSREDRNSVSLRAADVTAVTCEHCEPRNAK